MINEEQLTIDLVKKHSPAVVSVVISKSIPALKKMHTLPFLQPFSFPNVEEESPQEDNASGDKQMMRIGGGSGFVVHADGIILTNKHVVADRDAEYTVMIGDENEYSAHILSVDPINDIAFLKIDKKDLPVVPLGNSSDIAIGQTVIAIGTALGLFTNSVSKGIISGLSRRITASLGAGEETEELRGVIQTDVAINQGNSGGPLINTKGEALGINTAVIFGAQNIGFAIPINWAKRDLEDIQKHGRVIKPYLGLRYVMLNKKIQELHKLTSDHGALIVRGHVPTSKAVIPNSPADKAGIKENDIITVVDDTVLENKVELTDLIQEHNVGDEVTFTVLRDKKEIPIKLTLAEHK